MANRHKWITDDKGNKVCEKCGSRINVDIPENFYTSKYIERDKFGVIEGVNWYPRCFPIKTITYQNQ